MKIRFFNVEVSEMPQPTDPKLKIVRLIAEYQHAIVTGYPDSHRTAQREMLDALWSQIHALQVEIVGEG